jgi:hypothetical protein
VVDCAKLVTANVRMRAESFSFMPDPQFRRWQRTHSSNKILTLVRVGIARSAPILAGLGPGSVRGSTEETPPANNHFPDTQKTGGPPRISGSTVMRSSILIDDSLIVPGLLSQINN